MRNNPAQPQKPPTQLIPVRFPPKMIALSLFFLFAIGIVLVQFVLPKAKTFIPGTTENRKAIVQTLGTSCYEKYKREYDEEKRNLEVGALLKLLPVIDFATGENTKDSQLWLSYLSAYNRLYKEQVVREGREGVVRRVKEYYKTLAQTSVDLLSCYEEKLSSRPSYLERVKEFKKQSVNNLSSIDHFDFSELLRLNKEAEPLVFLGPRESKVYRLRTFCLDYYSGAPLTGDVYYIAGPVGALGKSQYCSLLKEAASGENLDEIQTKIWDVTFEAPREKTTLSGEIRTASGKPSLYEAYKQGKVEVRAVSPGTVIDLDVTLTNNTDEKLELDTACLQFIPAFSYTSKQIDDLDRLFGPAVEFEENQNVLGEEDSQLPPLESIPTVSLPRTREMIKQFSQPLATSGVQGDGPPLVELTSPEDALGPERDTAEKELAEALDEFKKNPTEETLKKLLDALARCRQVGCSSYDAALNSIKDTWQTKLDNVLETYRKNPTLDNLRELLKVERICAAFGCNFEGAMDEVAKIEKGRLEKALDEYKRNPTQENLKKLMEQAALCRSLGCETSDTIREAAKDWEGRVGEAYQDYLENPSPENYQKFLDAVRTCQELGCNVTSAIKSAAGLE